MIEVLERRLTGVTVRDSLVGREDFKTKKEWHTGVRVDEVATMPGLGGVGFTDKKVPSFGNNSPTPYIQLYCQEKVPTYAAFGNKNRGSHNLDQIPARSLPPKLMLDCRDSDDNVMDEWLIVEDRILGDARSQPERSFPARAEVRVSMDNLLETTHNMIVMLSRSTKSSAYRHYDNDDWFQWKALRARAAAKLPATIIGRPQSRPSDWSIVHVLLAAQAFVHGLHSRISEVTTERDTVNMHSLYLKVGLDAGTLTCRLPTTVLSLRERAFSSEFRPFFPAGVRTLHEYFDPSGGPGYLHFESRLRGMSNAEEKWKLKLRRGVGCRRNAPLERLHLLIGYPEKQLPARLPGPSVTASSANRAPECTIEQDAQYEVLRGLVLSEVQRFRRKELQTRGKEGKDLERYLDEHDVRDIPFIVITFGRTLGLLDDAGNRLGDAIRLDGLRALQQDDGRTLILNYSGTVEVSLDSALPAEESISAPARSQLHPGGLQVYDFLSSLPASVPRTRHAIRSLSVEWEIMHTAEGISLNGLVLPLLLRETPLPPGHNEHDRRDDIEYREWLRRAEEPSTPFPERISLSPSVGDFVIFIFSCFQEQLLANIPRTVRPNLHHPELEGLPYIKSLPEPQLSVSQNLMRDSFAGLPARLTRFVATQHTVTKWNALVSMLLPPTLERCERHPGWAEKSCTYLDLWRGLLERIKRLEDSRPLEQALSDISNAFVGSFKMLPDLSGKAYKHLKQNEASTTEVPLWDDTAFEKQSSSSLENFPPRWMSVSAGERISRRVRLAYTFTASVQKEYLGSWQYNTPIRESKNHNGVLHPSPPPFEYPWLKQNYHTVVSEKQYMMRREGLDANHFNPPGRPKGIGHDWWDTTAHDTISCSVCRTWSDLNPSTDLEARDDDSRSLDLSNFQLGGKTWGYFACWYVFRVSCTYRMMTLPSCSATEAVPTSNQTAKRKRSANVKGGNKRTVSDVNSQWLNY